MAGISSKKTQKKRFATRAVYPAGQIGIEDPDDLIADLAGALA